MPNRNSVHLSALHVVAAFSGGVGCDPTVGGDSHISEDSECPANMICQATEGLCIEADLVPPRIENAVSTHASAVFLTFTEPLRAAEAEDVAHYHVEGLNIVGATVVDQTVALFTDPQEPEREYLLRIEGLYDLAGNVIDGGDLSAYRTTFSGFADRASRPGTEIAASAERYYLIETPRTFFCIDSKLGVRWSRTWTQPASGVHAITSLFDADGYLIVIDGSEYAIRSLREGRVLHARSLDIHPNGFRTWRGVITVNKGRRKTAFPIFPAGFRSKHAGAVVAHSQITELHALLFQIVPSRPYREINVEDERIVVHVQSTIAAFDGSPRLIWRKRAPVAIRQVDRVFDMVAYAAGKRLVLLEPSTGAKIKEFSYREPIKGTRFGKSFYVYLEDGQRESVDLWPLIQQRR